MKWVLETAGERITISGRDAFTAAKKAAKGGMFKKMGFLISAYKSGANPNGDDTVFLSSIRVCEEAGVATWDKDAKTSVKPQDNEEAK